MAVTKTGLTAKPTSGTQTHSVTEYNKVIATIDANADELTAVSAVANSALNAANSATPLLQAETVAYLSRMIAAGDPIGQGLANAVDDFVVECKSASVLSDIVMFAPMIGSKISGALVKLVTETGGSGSMTVGNSSGALTFDPKKGFVLKNSTGTFISTGVIPSAQTLNKVNIGIGTLVPDYSLHTSPNGSALVSDNPISGQPQIYIAGNTEAISVQDGKGQAFIAGKRLLFMSIPSANEVYVYMNGGNIVKEVSDSASPTGVLNTVLTIFKTSAYDDTLYMSNAKVGSFIVTKGLNKEKARLLSEALYNLYVKIGRVETFGGTSVFFGDSNTAGQGITLPSDKFSVIVSAALGTQENNLGVPSSQLRSDYSAGGGISGGFQRYTGLLNKQVNRLFMIYGTNDSGAADGTTNGDATIIDDFRVKSETIIQDFKDKGSSVILGSIPYNTNSNLTKATAYVEAAALAASNKSVTFVDLYNLFLDTGNPTAYLSDGSLHFNTAGHALIASRLIDAARGIISRTPPLDFPSIAAGASANLTVKMYGARVNMAVSLGQPATPTAGIIYQAYVSANDTVTVKATNITAAAINPASQSFKVQVTL